MDLNQLLDKAKEATGSDNKTAARLGIERQMVHGWRKGKSSPNLDHIDELSQITGINFEACAFAVSYSKEKSAGIVGRFTKKLERIGVSVCLITVAGVNSVLSPSPAEAAENGRLTVPQAVYYVKRWLLRMAKNQGFAVC